MPVDNKQDKKLWFGNKKYGYGWEPNTWQGWASLGVWGIVVTLSTVWLSNQNDYPQTTYTLLYTLMMLISTGVLVLVSKLKGPKPKWRWGDKDQEK